VATTTAVGASATTVTESAATETRTAARRKTAGLAAVIIAAESAGAGAALASRSTVTASGVVVSIERPDGGAGAIVNSTRATKVSVVATIEIAVGIHAAMFTAVKIIEATVLATAIEIIAIVESAAVGVITIVIVDGVVAVPIESPTRPAPTVAGKKTDAKRGAEGEIGATEPDSRIGIPTGPSDDGTTVNGPWIVSGNVNDFRIGRLNGDGRVLIGDGLLRGGLEISRFLRAVTHDLNGIHYVGLLIVIGIAE